MGLFSLLGALLASITAGAPALEAAACHEPPSVAERCREGAYGDAIAEFSSLRAGEVEAIVRAAARALNVNTLTIAVVDRAGRVLALYRQPNANPANDDLAAGVARTAAFFSHNQAPLSSRTVRFISGIHFPPGVTNAPNAALYGIENTNRGCHLNVTFNDGKCLPPARSVQGFPCEPLNTFGCGTGIVTGKVQPDDRDSASVNAGGIPLYRVEADDDGRVVNGRMIGGIGVVGAAGESQIAEYAAVTGAFGALNAGVGAIAPVPQFPLPEPQNVFVDGIRLPFLGPDQRLRFNDRGLPVGLEPLDGVTSGSGAGEFVIGPLSGGCAPNEYLAGPRAGSRLTRAEVEGIVSRAIAASKRTRGIIRLPLGSYARMVIAVADLDGSILALYRMPDSTVFSVDVAVAKSRNVIYFSRESRDLPGVPRGTAVTNRTIGFGAQPLFPPGIDSRVFDVREGPFYDLFLRDLARPCSQGSEPSNANQNGIVFFPGASPLFRGTEIVGGLGISGDGVEQDDYVSTLAAGEFLPNRRIWADRIKIDGVRLPMFKFPRHPEGVTECGGKPCS